MRITLTDAGKRFNRDWVFRHINYEFTNGHSYAITGPNGSGKSTLLQLIAGSLNPSEGKIRYHLQDGKDSLAEDQIHSFLSLAAPYLEVVEEMTFMEFLAFHRNFKPFLPFMNAEKIISLVGLEKSAHKQIRYYSSGMKQRVKLAQAFFSNTTILLLDEPCTNLDSEGLSLYQRLIMDYCSDRLVIVSSNEYQEYQFCESQIDLMIYK
jgi:ABC-type multidrug transport system ATPase subunit